MHKNILKSSGFKAWVTVLAGLLCLVSMVACVPGVEKTNGNGGEKIYGYYRYQNTIYGNPASSYLVTKDNADDYIISEESFTILHKDGSKQKIMSGFEKSEVDLKSFAALFGSEINIPDISGFKQRWQYYIDKQYRLYVMDGEVWLAQYPGDTVWSIYLLVKVSDNYADLE